MAEIIIIIVLSIGNILGWGLLVSGGVKVSQEQTQISVQNQGQCTIINGESVYKNIHYKITNINNLQDFFTNLLEYQQIGAKISQNILGYTIIYPEIESITKIITNKTNR